MTSNWEKFILHEILLVKHYCRANQISCNINFPHLPSFLERSIVRFSSSRSLIETDIILGHYFQQFVIEEDEEVYKSPRPI